MNNHEKPMAVAMVICEKVITEEGTGNKTIVSVFNTISAKSFPCVHHLVCLYIALSNASGKKEMQLKLRSIGNPEVLFEAGGSVVFPNPNHVVELVFNLKNVVLPEPGLYVFEIFADEEYISEVRFNSTQKQNENSNS